MEHTSISLKSLFRLCTRGSLEAIVLVFSTVQDLNDHTHSHIRKYQAAAVKRDALELALMWPMGFRSWLYMFEELFVE